MVIKKKIRVNFYRYHLRIKTIKLIGNCTTNSARKLPFLTLLSFQVTLFFLIENLLLQFSFYLKKNLTILVKLDNIF